MPKSNPLPSAVENIIKKYDKRPALVRALGFIKNELEGKGRIIALDAYSGSASVADVTTTDEERYVGILKRANVDDYDARKAVSALMPRQEHHASCSNEGYNDARRKKRSGTPWTPE